MEISCLDANQVCYCFYVEETNKLCALERGNLIRDSDEPTVKGTLYWTTLYVSSIFRSADTCIYKVVNVATVVCVF